MTETYSLLNEQNAALLLNVSVPTLRKWRYKGRGPKFLKLGSLVRYKPSDIEQWLTTLPQGGESVRGQQPIGVSNDDAS